MFISYAICSHNEGQYLVDLLNRLTRNISQETTSDYEVVILDDFSIDPTTQMVLRFMLEKFEYVRVSFRKHEKDFSAQKNALNKLCKGDWIMNLDADEWIPDELMFSIPQIIESNPDVDAYWLSRLNTVDGLTDEYIKKWNWRITTLDGFDKPAVMWPDFQMRLYKNLPEIKWINKVHERLSGFKKFSTFPIHPDYAIRHFKTISRQIEQNQLYSTIGK